MIVNCYTCNKEFNKPACWVRRTKFNFCSTICHDTEQRNHKIYKKCKFCETIVTVRKSEMHKYSTCDNSICRNKNKKGSNNPGWKGGITNNRKRVMSTNAYKQWRKNVLMRDNYTCVFCNVHGGNLHVDHILPYAFFHDLRFDINNGRTLCVKCHSSIYNVAILYRSDKMPVLVKDLFTGKIQKFINLSECSLYFKSKINVIRKYLYQSDKCLIYKSRYLFCYEERNWPAFSNKDIGYYRNGLPKILVASNKKLGLSIMFEDCFAAAEYFKIKYVYLAMHILKYGDKPFNKWVFRYGDDPYFNRNKQTLVVI